MGNSIFDNPEYESPLGNWLQQDNAGSGSSLKKELTIQFLNAQSNSYVPYTGFATINFEVKAKNLHTGSAVLSITDYNFKGTLKGTPTTKNVYIKPNGTSTVNISIRASLLQYTDIQFEAKIICDGIERSTGKFEIGENDTASNKCFCNRDFTEKELRNIILELRKNTTDQKGNKIYPVHKEKIFYLGGDLDISEKNNYLVFLHHLNSIFSNKKYNINTCIRKLYFLAQCYVETQFFTRVKENIDDSSWYGIYKGRGLMQLTLKDNYIKYKTYSGLDVVTTPNLISKSMATSADSAGWFWMNNNINVLADNDNIFHLSKTINGINPKTKKPNGYVERKQSTEALKKIFNLNNCISRK